LRHRLVYPDLSCHGFNGKQKDYFLDFIVPPLLDSGKYDFTGICNIYNINVNTGKSWKKRREDGKKLQDSGGRPWAVDNNRVKEIIEVIDEAEKQLKPLNDNDIIDLIHDKAKTCSEERNRIYSEVKRPTVEKIKKRCKVKKRKAQTISNARYIACSDPAMSYCMYLMLKAFTAEVPSQLIWNWDFTQFIFDPSETQLGWVVADRARSRPITTRGDESLAIAIKYMHMGSADGGIGPMTLMISVPGMKEDEFVVKEVPGLSQVNIARSFGYLVFCSSRCGNSRVFKWFLETIVIKTITDARDAYRLYVSLFYILIYI